jgi:predicted DNA-binding transcriptional regulator YafY
MWQDPIIKETRELRNQYAAHFNHDLDAIFEDIKKRQAISKRKQVSFSHRKAIVIKSARDIKPYTQMDSITAHQKIQNRWYS